MKYRKKPVVIEAKQLTHHSVYDVAMWIAQDQDVEITADADCDISGLNIFTLEGVMHASMNDYIIRGVNGEFYPCKPDIFEKSYEPVND